MNSNNSHYYLIFLALLTIKMITLSVITILGKGIWKEQNTSSFGNEHQWLPKSRIKKQWFIVKSGCSLHKKNFFKTPFNSSQLGEILELHYHYQDIISLNLPLFEDSALEGLSKVKVEKYSCNTSYGNTNKSPYSAQ